MSVGIQEKCHTTALALQNFSFRWGHGWKKPSLQRRQVDQSDGEKAQGAGFSPGDYEYETSAGEYSGGARSNRFCHRTLLVMFHE